MAYADQTLKARITPAIREICRKYGVRATLSVRNHMSLALTISGGVIDFIGNYNQTCNPAVARTSIDVNQYYFQNHFSGAARDFLTEVFAAMNDGNYDRSDIQTDYFDVGWYVRVHIGRWNKPYAYKGD